MLLASAVPHTRLISVPLIILRCARPAALQGRARADVPARAADFPEKLPAAVLGALAGTSSSTFFASSTSFAVSSLMLEPLIPSAASPVGRLSRGRADDPCFNGVSLRAKRQHSAILLQASYRSFRLIGFPFCLFYAKTAVAEFRQGSQRRTCRTRAPLGLQCPSLAHLNRPEAARWTFFFRKFAMD